MKNAIVPALILVLVSIFVSSSGVLNSKEKVEDIYVENYIQLVFDENINTTSTEDSLYDSAINHLKDYEGYRGNVYIDNDGARTIGYGHHIKSDDSISIPLSEEGADKLLRNDFNYRIETVEEIHGDTLPYCKKIAITLLLYNIGSTKYRKSTVRSKIGLNLPPDDIWIQYCHYKKDGVTVAHPKLKERREFELKMYNYEPVY